MSMRGAIYAKIREMMDNPALKDHIDHSVRVLRNEPCLHINRENGSRYIIPFEDIYCQAYCRDVVSVEETVATALAWQDVLAGKIMYRFIEVREAPYADKEIEKNRAIMKDMVLQYNAMGVYDLKDADFWGGTQGADGIVEFNSPFISEFSGYSIGAGGDIAESFGPELSLGRMAFPLEVGYCRPYQMINHLSTERCVARFPYFHPYIVFFESLHVFPAR